MTGLLVSVRNLSEARAALAGGADVIDIKEPARGALGPTDPAVWREIVAEIGNRALVTAALGELASEAVAELAPQAAGLAFAKIGLAGCAQRSDWLSNWNHATTRLPATTRAVPVAYADWRSAAAPVPEEVLRLAAALPSQLLLIDTFDKGAGSLLDHWHWPRLLSFVHAARAARVSLVLAGSLQPIHFPQLLALEPAYIGVRGAACRGNREGDVHQALVAALAAQLPKRAA